MILPFHSLSCAAILAGVASSGIVLQVLGSNLFKYNFEYHFDNCETVRSGLNLPKVHDGVAPLNEPCHALNDDACSGYAICCATVGTCPGVLGRRWGVSTDKGYYEGGCNPHSLNSSHPDYDPACTQVGECHVGYLYATNRAVSAAGTMTELPTATLDRLMTGSNWCGDWQRCQNMPCSPAPNFSSCTGVQSGINLEKVHDGKAPLNEPCHSRRLCVGSMICCVTFGTCVPKAGERGVFTHSNKAYFEGGCSPRSLNKSHDDYDPDCTQVGECHHAYILQSRNGVSAPGAMTPTPSSTLNRLMAGSNWKPAKLACDDTVQQDTSYSSPRRAALGFLSFMVAFWE